MSHLVHSLISSSKTNEKHRRKRERDKRSSAESTPFLNSTLDANMVSQDHDQDLASQASDSSKTKGGGKGVKKDELPPEEAAKRARIRIAARERQRKHRAGIKAKRMAQLGMAIVNAGGGIEQTAIGYTINENGQYEAVLADPNHPNVQLPPIQPPFPIPQPHATPGQIFASTLLLSLSYTPRLKNDLLRTLQLSPEKLAEFEPIVAAAFDHWEYSRSMRYVIQSDHLSFDSVPQSYSDFRGHVHRPLGAAVFDTDHHHGADNSFSLSDESHHEDQDFEVQLERNRTQSELQEPFRLMSDLRQNFARNEIYVVRDEGGEGVKERLGTRTARKVEDEDS